MGATLSSDRFCRRAGLCFVLFERVSIKRRRFCYRSLILTTALWCFLPTLLISNAFSLSLSLSLCTFSPPAGQLRHVPRACRPLPVRQVRTCGDSYNKNRIQ